MDDVSINRQFLETDDEEKACELLFNKYYKTVFAKIDRMMRNPPDPAVGAEDITQETFIKAFKERRTLREPEKLRGWLLTIAKNLTLNEIRDAERRRRRETGNSLLESLESLSISEREAPYLTSLAETDAAQAEAIRYLVRQLLRLLQGKDREVIAFMYREFMYGELTTQEIAEAMDTTPDAIQKRLERIRKWLIPVARNLDALINCLPAEKDRKIMERYLDGQSLSEIAKAIVGFSRSKVEETVKRVIKQWKEAAQENPTDPVSAMVNNES